MGNLYTHIVRQQSPRIKILAKLKSQYQSFPRDWKEINRLKKLLIKSPWTIIKKQNIPKLKKTYGLFQWKYDLINS